MVMQQPYVAGAFRFDTEIRATKPLANEQANKLRMRLGISERDATGERSVSLAKIAVVVQQTSCGPR